MDFKKWADEADGFEVIFYPLCVICGILLLVNVLIAGCSDKKTSNTYVTAPSAPPETVFISPPCVDKHGRPCKPRGGKH